MQIDCIEPKLAQQPMLPAMLVVERVALERDQVRRDIGIGIGPVSIQSDA